MTERVVTQRLRLGKLAPNLLNEPRAGRVSLETVMAFTLAPDHKTQLAAWRQIKEQPWPTWCGAPPTQATFALDSPLGAFVARDAYEAAGGKVTIDLFSEDHDMASWMTRRW